MSQPHHHTENPPPVVTQPTASPPPAHRERKVSIANDPVMDSLYDNLAYEPCSKQQKTSQVCSFNKKGKNFNNSPHNLVINICFF